MKLLRSFIALELPPAVRDSLEVLQKKLRPLARDIKWTKTDSVHLTLFFLGEIEEERFEAVGKALEEGFAIGGPFELHPEGAGAFPLPERARVVVAGVGGDVKALAALLEEINKRLLPLGFTPERRPFKPHLTIGRVRREKRFGGVKEALGAAEDFKGPSWRVEKVILYTSDLQPGGAVYTPRVSVVIR
ncbi:RNA 2',3'-cyclic phosphodiesterase [bacterium]|nr:MAG: RNA 2',3'-cyclic phosphodiesterase [bacterium]